MDFEQLVQFHQCIRLASVDTAQNRRRFYELRWEPTLFDQHTLVRTYGRLGTPGRSVTLPYSDRANAQSMIRALLRRRLRHGYQVDEIDGQPPLFA